MLDKEPLGVEVLGGNLDRLKDWKDEAGQVPDTTCPRIDDAIKFIDRAMKNCKIIDKAKCESCSDYASDAYYDLSGIEDDLEKLRADNAQLRELGQFWYKKCKQLLEESNQPTKKG